MLHAAMSKGIPRSCKHYREAPVSQPFGAVMSPASKGSVTCNLENLDGLQGPKHC